MCEYGAAMRITDSLLRSFRIARTYPNTQTVNCLDFSQNGESAVSSSDDDCIVIYDIREGKYVEFVPEVMFLLSLHYNRIYCVFIFARVVRYTVDQTVCLILADRQGRCTAKSMEWTSSAMRTGTQRRWCTAPTSRTVITQSAGIIVKRNKKQTINQSIKRLNDKKFVVVL